MSTANRKHDTLSEEESISFFTSIHSA